MAGKFDLEERTARFAEEIIDFVKEIKKDEVNSRIIAQVVGSGGSIGANYCEATEGESKKDFLHKICICKKEIKETRHWLRLLARTNPEKKEKIRLLWQEAQ
ncbi:MAG: four helix bundle protein [Patescibacteria group bacterium]|nr:four helix bundle protein [Patescibacteria group bacterium]